MPGHPTYQHTNERSDAAALANAVRVHCSDTASAMLKMAAAVHMGRMMARRKVKVGAGATTIGRLARAVPMAVPKAIPVTLSPEAIALAAKLERHSLALSHAGLAENAKAFQQLAGNVTAGKVRPEVISKRLADVDRIAGSMIEDASIARAPTGRLSGATPKTPPQAAPVSSPVSTGAGTAADVPAAMPAAKARPAAPAATPTPTGAPPPPQSTMGGGGGGGGGAPPPQPGAAQSPFRRYGVPVLIGGATAAGGVGAFSLGMRQGQQPVGRVKTAAPIGKVLKRVGIGAGIGLGALGIGGGVVAANRHKQIQHSAYSPGQISGRPYMQSYQM